MLSYMVRLFSGLESKRYCTKNVRATVTDFSVLVRVQEKAPGVTKERYLASACGFSRPVASRTKISRMGDI
jgi:hypothetical protein